MKTQTPAHTPELRPAQSNGSKTVDSKKQHADSNSGQPPGSQDDVEGTTATKTWNGTTDQAGSFTDKTLWTPRGAPRAGDTAEIAKGIVDARNLDLWNIPLKMGAATPKFAPLLQLQNVTIGSLTVAPGTSGQSKSASTSPLLYADLRVSGQAALSGPVQVGAIDAANHGRPASLSVAFGSNATLYGYRTSTITTVGGSVVAIGGTARNRFAEDGTVDLIGSTMTVGAMVEGSGTFNLEPGSGSATSLTFSANVSAKETVNVESGKLNLAEPLRFLGSIAESQNGTVVLQNITSTSETYANGVLDVFDNKTLVAALKITGSGSFVVTQSGADTCITTSTTTGSIPQIFLLSDFRPIGAVGNNLVNPSLNPTPGSAEIRVTPAHYAPGTTDGLVDGPNPRTISNVVTSGPQAQVDDPTYSAWLYGFGQFIDHDLGLEEVGDTAINIPVPNGDPNFADGSSILLTRVVNDPTTGTAINTVAGYLDLSQLYGSDAATAASLRNADGTLKTSAGDALPLVDGYFVSGDTRVMENPEITVITTLFMREHNYWVGVLQEQHPSWTGDQLYDMAKAITTAEYQNIIYSEYLPALVGPSVGPYQGYDSSVSAQETQEFSGAAFRVGHSQVSNNQTGIDNDGNVTFSQTLGESFFNTPAQDIANDGIDSLLRDLSSDGAQETDVYAVDGLRNLLVSDPDKMDLIAIDIQRERDLGLGTLNETRQALGLTPYTSFAQLTSDPTVQANLKTVYGSIDKVDLFIGGLAENHAPGADVGQTFQTIITDQFDALRAGDRYFWQNEGFDPATAQMIAQTTLGDIIERDTGTAVVQQNVFITAERHLSNVAASDPTAPQLVIGVDTANATISGGPADDTIVAGAGLHQILTGGGGADVFIFIGASHTDTITDFSAASDTIKFQSTSTGDSTASPLTGDDAVLTVQDLHGSAVVSFDGNQVTLTGVDASTLQASNFILPTGSSIDLFGHSVLSNHTT